VKLQWSGFNDEFSAIQAIKLYYSTKPYPNLNQYSLIYQSLDNFFTHQNLKKGTTYYYWWWRWMPPATPRRSKGPGQHEKPGFAVPAIAAGD